MSRATFTITAGVVLCSVAFVSWKSNQPPTVEVTRSVRHDVTSTLAISGILEAVDRSTIASQVAGARVTKVFVDIGDTVQKGQILAELDPSDAQAQLKSADAQIAQAAAQSAVQDVTTASARTSLSLAKEYLKEVNDLRLTVSSAETNNKTAQQRVKQLGYVLSKVLNGGRDEQIRQSKSQLQKAQTIRDLRKREFERAETLFNEGALSKASYEVANSALHTAESDVEFAKEQVKIESTPRIEDVNQAQSQLTEARQIAQGASDSLELSKKVLEQRIVARQQFVQAQGQRDTAFATKRVSQAQGLAGSAQRQAALATLAKTQIRAPFSGRISQRLVEPGQTVGLGASLFIVAGTGRLRIRLNVDEANISLINIGDRATVSIDAFPNLQLPAVVSDIGSAANFLKGTVEVRLRLLKSDEKLKPDLTVDVNLVIGTYKAAVTIPRQAVINPDDRPEVYVAKNGRIESRAVKWKRGNTESIVITEGLTEGEEVLLSPRLSHPGDRVKVVPSKLTGAH